MTTASFEQLQAQHYAEAYELFLQHAHRFPERRWSIDNWKMCFSMLQEKSIPYQVEEHPKMGHTYPPDFASALPRALAFILHTQETG